MMIIGLTGSIGMGKSTLAALFAQEGVPVFDADAQVHRLYAQDKALIAALERRFAGVVVKGKVDRQKLASLVHGNKNALKDLEGLVHARVAQARARWLQKAERAGHDLVLFDIPLLFETGGEGAVDKTIVASAPAEIQEARVLARPGMSAERLAHIRAAQMPDQQKRARADIVIDTSKSLEETALQVHELVRQLGAEARQAQQH